MRAALASLLGASLLLASAGSLAQPAAPRDGGPEGLVLGLSTGVLVLAMSSRDELRVPVSPSRVESHDAKTFGLGLENRLQLGYLVGPSWGLALESRFAPLFGAGDVLAGSTLLLKLRLSPETWIRAGLGFAAAEVVQRVETEASAGPGRSVDVEVEQQLQGAALHMQIGLEAVRRLWGPLLAYASFDLSPGLLQLGDEPDRSFDDGVPITLSVQAGLVWDL